MKAKKKTNHLQGEAEKIKQIPEDKDKGHDGQDKLIKAKKPRKNRFLARLRKIWVRITGCMRCSTYTQEERSAEELSPPNGVIMEEEFPSSSGTNMEELTGHRGVKIEEEHPALCRMEDSKVTILAEGKDENVEENQIKPDNEEAEVVVIDSLVEEEIQANQRLLHLIHSQEDMYVQYYSSQQEILAKYDPIHNLIQIVEDLHTLHYDTEGEQQDGEQLEIKVGEDAEGKIKEDGEYGLENAGSTKESQRASCKTSGPSHISNTDSKGENNSISINENRDKSTSEQKFSRKSITQEEETSEELFKITDTYHSGSSDYMHNFCSLEEDTPEEVSKSIKTCQCGSSHDEEPITIEKDNSISINEKIDESRSEQTSSKKSNSLEEELFKITKTSSSGSSDYISNFCLLEEDNPEEVSKSIKTSQCGSSHDEEPITIEKDNSISINEKIDESRSEQTSSKKSNSLEEELFKITKTSSSGSSDYISNFCLLEEDNPEEVSKSIKTCQCGSSHDEEPITIEKDNSISINEKIDESRSEQTSSKKSNSLEEELFKITKTSSSGSSDYISNFCLLEEDNPEEVSKSIKTSQCGSSHDEEPITIEKDNSIRINEKIDESRSEQTSSKSNSLEEELFKITKTSSSGSSDYISNFCLLEEDNPEEVSKSIKTCQCGSSHDEEPITIEKDNSISINEKIDESRSEQTSSKKSNSLEEELFKITKTSSSGSSDYISNFCLLEEDTPEEVSKSIKTCQCGSSHDEEPITIEKDNSISINEKIDESRSEQTSSKKSNSLEEELFKITKTSSSGSSDYISNFCLLEEHNPEEVSKSIKTSQCGSSHDEEPIKSDKDNIISINEKIDKSRSEQKSSRKSNSLEEEVSEELLKITKTSQSGNNDYTSNFCSLEEVTPEEEPITSDNCLEKLEQPVEHRPATIPIMIHTFTFHQELGEGAFGKVYLATDKFRKECVAVKVSNKCSFTEYKNFFGERQILQLSHESPYLIHGLAAFHTENFVYYVTELATRGNLLDFLLNNFPLDTPTIQFIVAEVICGIQFLHNRGIIHRDLKLENILLTTNGHVKIADFGLSLMNVYERTKEKPAGTLQYMAPEMLRGQEYGRGVDYFAIGVMMYTMFTDEHPFPPENLRSITYSILKNTPLYPEFLTPDTVDILEGLLCKDQDHRLGVVGDIKKHPFFSDINWEDIEDRRVEPPAIMTAAVVNLNTEQTCDYLEMPTSKRPEDQKIFKEFSFVCPDWSQYYHPVSDETKSWMA